MLYLYLSFLYVYFTFYRYFSVNKDVCVARSSSDGNAIRYVLPVLSVTSCFHIMEPMGHNKRQRVCFGHQFSGWQQRGRSLPTVFLNFVLLLIMLFRQESFFCTTIILNYNKYNYNKYKVYPDFTIRLRNLSVTQIRSISH